MNDRRTNEKILNGMNEVIVSLVKDISARKELICNLESQCQGWRREWKKETFKKKNSIQEDRQEEIKENIDRIQEQLLDEALKLKKKEQDLNNCKDTVLYLKQFQESLFMEKKILSEVEWGKGLSPYRLLEVQEMERKRISMDLHDTTVQNLTTLVHKTEVITKLIDRDPVQAKLELQTSLSMVRSTIKELREIIYNLRPMSIDDLGLTLAVEHFVKQMECENQQMEFDLEIVDFEDEQIAPVISMTLYRVLQEACNNIKKHAKARQLWIGLTSDYNNVYMTIEDDGCGFDTGALVDKDKNFGLSIMKERINLLSGNFELESKIGSGTKISVSVPLTGIDKEEEKHE